MSAPIVRRAVAIGGGTGLPSVLRCLLDLGFDTTAVVTMADDGGSSGALRRGLGILPPGDVRNCLVAMAADPEGLSARMVQYRFAGAHGLGGHALGNLILAALTDLAGGFPEAIEVVGDYLDVRGRVLPSTLEDVLLHGVDRQGNEVFGQAKLAANPLPVQRAYLDPAAPAAYPPALDAIREADVVVIGPGSLYTSLIPNFLVDGVTAALGESSAQCVYVCNVANMRGETQGHDAAEHVQALVDHGLADVLDTVVVHRSDGAEGPRDEHATSDVVEASDAVLARIAALGPAVVTADVADPAEPMRHSREALCRVLEEVCGPGVVHR